MFEGLEVWKFEVLKSLKVWTFEVWKSLGQGPGTQLGVQAMVYIWRVHTSGESFSNFQNFRLWNSWARGLGPNWGPKLWFTLGESLHVESPFQTFKISNSWARAGAQLGTQAMVYPWRVCTRGESFSNFQKFFQTFKVWISFQVVKLSNFPLRTVSNLSSY